MKLSLNWLNSYFEKIPDWDDIFYRLTMAGIEVESIVQLAPAFSGVVVGEVVECSKHPDADKLTLCKVNIGKPEMLQIVCGANNVKSGIKVPCALVGGVLPDGLVISERKMRGVDSFGMLCGGDEICCPDGVDGLLILDSNAPIGMSIREYLGLDDKIVEFKITPNRGDCLSVNGILREISVLTDYQLKLPVLKIKCSEAAVLDQVSVRVDDAEGCPGYYSLIVKGVSNQGSLPKELIKRLECSGIRSISPIVDITNYVMLEIGQPLHAFDLDKIGGELLVRRANVSEQMKLLDGKEVNLTPETLIVCDSKNNPVAIAGVMGGDGSGVKADTTDIVLESAFFAPDIISGRAKYYGVSSDSAYRFERGVDPKLQELAIQYAASLIQEYCGGQIGRLNKCITACKCHTITITYSEIITKIGMPIETAVIDKILANLGFKLLAKELDEITVEVPDFRFDVTIKADIIEEIVRIYGYDNILPIMPIAGYAIDSIDGYTDYLNSLKDKLVNLGYTEVISYAFIDEKSSELFGMPNQQPVKLQNPIAGWGVMRTSLIPDLIKTLINNTNRGHKRLQVFELARVFHGEAEHSQPLKLAGLIYGNDLMPGWANKTRTADFYDLKHDVEILLSGISSVEFIASADYPVLHSGRCARIYAGNQEVGIIGQLHPKYIAELGLADLPYLFELDVGLLSRLYLDSKITVKEVSKFQKVERDLAFMVDIQVEVGKIMALINQSEIPNLISSNVFDVYQGNNLEEGLKSIAINFIFQGSKTLTEDDINQSISKVIKLVTEEFFARLR